MSSWSLLTGKKLPRTTQVSHQIEELKQFEPFQFIKPPGRGSKEPDKSDNVYGKGWYNKILLVKKTPEQGYDENKFFDPKWFTRSYIESQDSFIKKSKKEFYEFKIIEIVHEYNVIEHCKFIHPVYERYAGAI